MEPGEFSMKSCKSSLAKRSACLILLATFVLPAASNAQSYKFEVVYAEVAGSSEIRARNPDAAIEILERRAQEADKHYVAGELATLCGLYIVKGRLSAASVTCQEAVETDRSALAYNNRGVFRVRLGDASGALEDFARARNLPDNQQRYIEEFVKGDAQFVASNNYVLAKRYAARMRGGIGQAFAGSVLGASIEDLGNQ